MAALGDLVTAGKIRHIGVANESPWGVMRYLRAAEQSGLPRIVSIQNGYSLLDRQFEIGRAEIAIRERVGLLAYSPLARGLLTGTHADGEVIPAGGLRFTERRRRITAEYAALAHRHGMDRPTMALAFVRQKPFTTAVLMAACNVSRLEQNLKSLKVTLSKDVLKEIDSVHDDAPNPR